MQRESPRCRRSARAWSTGVVAEDRRLREVALAQADGVPALEVDRGVERDHDSDARARRRAASQRSSRPRPAALDFSGWNCTPDTPRAAGGRAEGSRRARRCRAPARGPRARSRRCARSSRSSGLVSRTGGERALRRPGDLAPADVGQLERGAQAPDGARAARRARGRRGSPRSRRRAAAGPGRSPARARRGPPPRARRGRGGARGCGASPRRSWPTPGSTTASAPATDSGARTTLTSAPSSSRALVGAAQVAHLVVEHRHPGRHRLPFGGRHPRHARVRRHGGGEGARERLEAALDGVVRRCPGPACGRAGSGRRGWPGRAGTRRAARSRSRRSPWRAAARRAP